MEDFVNLCDVCDFQGGSQPPKEQWIDVENDGYIRMLQIRDFTQKGKVKPEYVKINSGIKTCSEDDILIARYGASLGKILTGLSGAYNVAIMKTIPDEKRLKKRYLYYFLSSDSFQNVILNVGSRAAQAGFNKEDLRTIKLYCPNFERQKEICKVLDKIYRLIEDRQQQLKILDNLVQSRFVEMFGDERNFMPMSDLCLIITDGTHQPPKFISEGIPFIFVSNIVGNEVTYDAEKFISQETYNELIKRTPVEIGDVLLSTVGSYGHPAIVKSDKKFLFQRHIAYLKPKKEMVDSNYLHEAFLAPDVQRQIEESVKGIAQKTLNLSEIKKITIPVPNLTRQKQFAAFVHQTDKSKLTIQKSLEKLETLKKSLMQQYFG